MSKVPEGTKHHILNEDEKQAFWDKYHPAVVRARHHDVIMARLDHLDHASTRSLRAIAKGAATDTDRQKLAELEGEAEKLRAELAGL